MIAKPIRLVIEASVGLKQSRDRSGPLARAP